MPLRIGVNALYLIPGGVGGTEIYLRSLLAALAEIDRHNQYFVFTNRETGSDPVPAQANFTHQPQAVRAPNRPPRPPPAASGPCRQSPGAPPLGATLPAASHRPPPARRTLQPRLHRAHPLRLPAGHRVSRPPAQTAPRIDRKRIGYR